MQYKSPLLAQPMNVFRAFVLKRAHFPSLRELSLLNLCCILGSVPKYLKSGLDHPCSYLSPLNIYVTST